MALLHIAVLVRTIHARPFRLYPVMAEHSSIPLRELLAMGHLVYGCRELIRPMAFGHPVQFPESILEAGAQALQALREANRARLPVRVGQHEVVQQVIERLARDRHPQRIHACEVRLRQLSWSVPLREEHLPGRARYCPPVLHSSLQSSQLPIGEASRFPPLQRFEERLRLQTWRLLQERLTPGPYRIERIGASPPRP